MEISFKTVLWEWEGKGAWCFVTIPSEYYEDIRLVSSPFKKSFGSVKVAVRVGDTNWLSSLFPTASPKSYLLPVKKEVRQKENIAIGELVTVTIRIILA